MADWKHIVGTFAPMAAGFLGGPGASAAVAAVARAVGLPVGATEKEVSVKVMSMTPEERVALRQADVHLEVEQLKADVAQTQLVLADKADARDMHKNRQEGDNTARNLAYLSFVGVAGYLLLLVFFGSQIAPNLVPVLTAVGGTLVGCMGTAFAFYLGSSASSKSKTGLIAKMTGNGE